MEEQYQLTLNDYLEIAKRRWLHFVAPFVVLFMAAIGVALYLPPVYQSSGTILIESQQIPEQLIRSTVTSYVDERVQVITQLVMTRENLLAIANKFELYGEDAESISETQRADLLRNRIEVAPLPGQLTARRNRSAIAFSVSYEDGSPGLSYLVANELVTLFLEENIRTRTERANETTQFLSDQSEKLRAELDDIESKIADFKQANGDALPEHLDMHMSMRDRADADYANIERDIKTARDELRLLEIERSAIDSGLAVPDSPSAATSPAQNLAIAQAELTRLEGIYAPKHPSVRRQKQLVENLQAEVASSSAEADSAGDETAAAAVNLDLARINAQVESVESRLDSLESQRRELADRRTELEEIIIKTPQVQRELSFLSRDYENIRAKYQEIEAKEMEAQVAESLEEGEQGERFSLIEPPVRPEKPVKPNRQKIMFFGFVLSGAAALGLVILLELSDQRIRGIETLTRLMGDRPMVAIPYIVIDEEVAFRRRMIRLAAAAALASGLVAAAAIHVLYMPLDELMIKIMTRMD